MNAQHSIFLAEDNAADVVLIREALLQTSLNFRLQRVKDGEAAWQALAEIEKKQLPLSVILLDLNLPKVSGHELLARIRESHHLGTIPVIVLTSSDFPGDRARTAALKISHYFRKPSDLSEFLKLGNIVQRICEAGNTGADAGAGA
jgi:CheY-like chemotaxis protein